MLAVLGLGYMCSYIVLWSVWRLGLGRVWSGRDGEEPKEPTQLAHEAAWQAVWNGGK